MVEAARAIVFLPYEAWSEGHWSMDWLLARIPKIGGFG